MSKYTTLLRWPIEQKLDDLGLAHEEANWPQVYGILGLDDYPIFEEAHRQVLNDKIIRRYYMREIGFETMGLFRWHMRSMMHEIMPYYNQLYESEALVTDPLLSKDMTYKEIWSRDETRDGSSKSGTEASSTTDSRNVFQDTPMNGLDTGAIADMDYASTVTFDHGTSSSTSNNASESNATLDADGTRTHQESGFDGSQSELLLKYRDTFLNIDLEIVDRLSVLFMGLW